MPTQYCPSAGCGAATDYQVSRPTVCPKCGNAYAAAFAGTNPAAPVAAPSAKPRQVATRVVSQSHARSVLRSSRESQPIAEVETEVQASSFMQPVGSEPVAPPTMPATSQVDDGSEYDESATKEEITAAASEISASLNVGHGIRISIPDQSDDVMRLSGKLQPGAFNLSPTVFTPRARS